MYVLIGFHLTGVLENTCPEDVWEGDRNYILSEQGTPPQFCFF